MRVVIKAQQIPIRFTLAHTIEAIPYNNKGHDLDECVLS